MAKRDYYEVLGVNKNATPDEIKTRYRQTAMQFHPDRNPGDSEAEDKFKEASEAYDVLGNQEKRARYDRFGHEGLRGSSGGSYSGFSNIEDIFSAFGDVFGGGGGGIFDDFFGGGRSRSRRSVGERGSDIRIRLPLTLEEIASGVDKTLKLSRLEECNHCGGSGAAPGAGNTNSCTTCNGVGEVRQVQRSMFGQMVNIAICPTCNGSGQVVNNPCKECHGECRVKIEDTLQVSIPAGVEDGNYMPVRGKGNAGKRGGPAGDLIVMIEEKEHEHFTRQGDDILYELLISYPVAALGGEVEIMTLEGPDKINIKSGTQPGTTIRMRDKGLPHLNTYGKGDLIIYVNLWVPEKLDSKEKAMMKELAEKPNICPLKKNKAKSKDFIDRIKDIFN